MSIVGPDSNTPTTRTKNIHSQLPRITDVTSTLIGCQPQIGEKNQILAGLSYVVLHQCSMKYDLSGFAELIKLELWSGICGAQYGCSHDGVGGLGEVHAVPADEL